jgi:hypothetical protein
MSPIRLGDEECSCLGCIFLIVGLAAAFLSIAGAAWAWRVMWWQINGGSGTP